MDLPGQNDSELREARLWQRWRPSFPRAGGESDTQGS